MHFTTSSILAKISSGKQRTSSQTSIREKTFTIRFLIMRNSLSSDFSKNKINSKYILIYMVFLSGIFYQRETEKRRNVLFVYEKNVFVSSALSTFERWTISSNHVKRNRTIDVSIQHCEKIFIQSSMMIYEGLFLEHCVIIVREIYVWII